VTGSEQSGRPSLVGFGCTGAVGMTGVADAL